MKQSTLDMLDAAMAFNVSVQEDHINLQEMKYHLLQLNRDLENLKARSSFESVDANFTAMQNKIGTELLSMIDCSIADIDKRMDYPHFLEVEDKTAIMYNIHTIWNICTSLKDMLISIGKLGCQDLAYEALRNQFMQDNELNMTLTGTTISQEDYVEINMVQPKNQSTTDAEMTKDNLNACNKLLNNFIDQNTLKDLANIKYAISIKLASDRVDAIESAHFISQIIMAVKNASHLVKNYYAATLNELNPTITDAKKEVWDIPRMVKAIKTKQNEIREMYRKMSDTERYGVGSAISKALDWSYDESMSEKEVKRQLSICYDVDQMLKRTIERNERAKWATKRK